MAAKSSQIHNPREPNLELMTQITSRNQLRQPMAGEAASQFFETSKEVRQREGARQNRRGRERADDKNRAW